jgi:sugar phosphate permease
VIIIGIPLGYIILSFFNSVYGLFIILIFYFIRGLATPVLKDYINRITQSDIRATVLSVRSLIIRLTFAVAGPFFGWVTDQKDLQAGLLTAGIFFLIFAFITGFLFIYTLRKNR